MAKKLNLVGETFGRLTVVCYSHSNNGQYFKCICECGEEKTVKAGLLVSGGTQSCGCLAREARRKAIAIAIAIRKNKKHGMSRHPLDGVFDNMKSRCYKPGTRRYERYGGREITICEEWLLDRKKFYDWAMAHGYKKGLTIDRKDNDGNYCPGNCRFANAITQMNNTSRNKFLTWKGETMTVANWARRLGGRGQTLQHRVTRGWSIERIFTQPFRKWPCPR